MKHRSSVAVSLTSAYVPEQRQMGSSAGAARLRKDNTGAQRQAQTRQNRVVEGKAKCLSDWILQRKGSKAERLA